MNEVLRMEGITKSFSGIPANDDINISLNKDEILSLLGENGAGKTTLMNVLCGLYAPDSGKIYINGEEVNISSPLKAIKYGIRMIHQHFMLIPEMTVIENIILGSEPRKGLKVDMDLARKDILDLNKFYNFAIDLDSYVKHLSVGQQQRVEILRAVYKKFTILILDEPTTVLTSQESKELFKMLKMFSKEGKSIIFISHKLKEVMAISDRITVLRKGKVVDTLPASKANEKLLGELMVGREVIFKIDKGENRKLSNEPFFKVDCLNVRSIRNQLSVKNVSFNISGEEILGIGGVDGNGQIGLVEAITGVSFSINSGHIYLDGEEITGKSPSLLYKKGLCHIPQDRRARGLVCDFTIWENLLLRKYEHKPFSNFGFINKKLVQSYAEELIEKYDIRATNCRLQVSKLSGGNQQKVILARELADNPRVIIAMNPTSGLDVGAREFVYNILLEARNAGAAILLVSTELQEVLTLCDYMAVMYEGEMSNIFKPEEVDISTIGKMMGGIKCNV